MNWIDKTLRICPDRSDFLVILKTRYSIEVDVQEEIDGVAVAISPAEQGRTAFAIYADDRPLTRYRIAEAIGYSDVIDDSENVIGRDYQACWTEHLISDLENPDKGPEDALLFDGVQVL